MNFLTPRKMKTKRDKNQIFAGVVDYLTINILKKIECPILISSEVLRDKINCDINFFDLRKTKTKKDIKLNFIGLVNYFTSKILSQFESPIFISSEVMGVCHVS